MEDVPLPVEIQQRLESCYSPTLSMSTGICRFMSGDLDRCVGSLIPPQFLGEDCQLAVAA